MGREQLFQSFSKISYLSESKHELISAAFYPSAHATLRHCQYSISHNSTCKKYGTIKANRSWLPQICKVGYGKEINKLIDITFSIIFPSLSPQITIYCLCAQHPNPPCYIQQAYCIKTVQQRPRNWRTPKIGAPPKITR